MPARTVVFHQTQKHDGRQLRDLLPGEYTQMSGRAGRRGLDEFGTVIILTWGEVPEASGLQKMLTGKASMLESQFRLTYSMILNLLRLGDGFRVEDMMKRSFSESANQRIITENRERLKKGEAKLLELQEIECKIGGKADIEHYCEVTKALERVEDDIQYEVLSAAQSDKFIVPGRVIIIHHLKNPNALAVIMNVGKSKFGDFETQRLNAKKVQVLVMTGKLGGGEKDAFEITSVPGSQIKRLCKRKIPVEKGKSMNRQSSTIYDELVSLAIETYPHLPKTLDPVKDLKLKALHFTEMLEEKSKLQTALINSKCYNCDHLEKQYAKADKRYRLRNQVEALKKLVSDSALFLMPEFESRRNVLKLLHYINRNQVVLLKGKVARELTTCEELIATEVIFNGILNPLSPQEIAALLSVFVFQDRGNREIPYLNENLQLVLFPLLFLPLLI